MSSYPPALVDALDTIDEDTFVREPGGNVIAQSSSSQIIADLINRLDLCPGMTVLEIGTGSGYSTALLAHLTGNEGRVVSVDVVAELVDRARALLPASGFTNSIILSADGVQGAPGHGPFDRIIAWATAAYLPTAWISQLASGGVIVAPIALAPVSKSGIGTRIHLTDGATPYVDHVFPAGFVEMHGQELDQWLVPPYGVDIAARDAAGRAFWLSGPWLRNSERQLQGRELLDGLIDRRSDAGGPLQPGESADDFRAWLLATQPDGLTTAALGEPTWRIGYSHSLGAALTDTRTATHTVTTGDPDAAHTLATWAATWRRAGSPGITDLRAHLATFQDGWVLTAGIGSS